MPRKTLKRLLPHPDVVRHNRAFRMLGERLHDPNLWHLNHRAAALGVAIGLFCGFLPTAGQTLLAAFMAFWFRGNLPLAACFVWISNPLTFAPLLVLSYRIGAWLLQLPASEAEIELTWAWLSQFLAHRWQPVLLGSLICGAISAMLGYQIVIWLWRLSVSLRLRERRQRRRQAPARSRAP